MEYKIEVTDMDAIRIDVYLSQKTDISRSKIQSLLKNGKILLNAVKAKARDKVKIGDVITFSYEPARDIDIEPVKMPLDIVYEDSELLVINKPKGLVTHPAPGNSEYTLVHGLKAYTDSLSDINGKFRPGIVHRLDKDTSGLLVVAKNDRAHEFLAQQLSDKRCFRRYLGIVYGVMEHDEGVIDAPIGRDKKDRQKMAVVADGKRAITEFNVLKRFKESTFLDIELKTGRTHQIRVHMKYINHPILNDPKYDPKHVFDQTGQYLHAYYLSFIHPLTNERVEFETDIPSYMSAYIKERNHNEE